MRCAEGSRKGRKTIVKTVSRKDGGRPAESTNNECGLRKPIAGAQKLGGSKFGRGVTSNPGYNNQCNLQPCKSTAPEEGLGAPGAPKLDFGLGSSMQIRGP